MEGFDARFSKELDSVRIQMMHVFCDVDLHRFMDCSHGLVSLSRYHFDMEKALFVPAT